MKDELEAIIQLQTTYPQLILCGSVALILQGLLDKRPIGDIDFVLINKDLPSMRGLKEDRYIDNDKYDSYHATYSTSIWSKNFSINLLVFTDDVIINSELVTIDGRTVKVQKLDDILYWKKDYGRDKDIKDLDNIAAKIIEKTFLTDGDAR